MAFHRINTCMTHVAQYSDTVNLFVHFIYLLQNKVFTVLYVFDRFYAFIFSAPNGHI